MRDQWLDIELALGNESERFLAIATVHVAVIAVLANKIKAFIGRNRQHIGM
jgi:hypothetical protein